MASEWLTRQWAFEAGGWQRGDLQLRVQEMEARLEAEERRHLEAEAG